MASKVLCRTLFLSAFLSLAFAYGDTNVLVNPGFEDGTIGWSGRNCSIEAVTSPVNSGSGSAKASGRTANWQGIKQSMLYGKMVDGETYQIQGWVRLENAPSDTVTVSIEQQDDNGTNYYNVASATATDSNWVQLSGNFTLDVNDKLSVLDVYFEGPAPGINFYVDDANVHSFQPSPAEPSPAEPSPAEPSPAEPSPAEPSPAEPSPAEPNAIGQIDVNARHQKIEGYGDTNILVNPGFETNTIGWSGRNCSIEAVSTPVHSGSGSAKASGRDANWQGIKQSMFGKMVDGETYQIQGWVRLENAPSDTVTVSFEQQDDSGTNYYNVASATATDSNWVQLSGNFTLDVVGTLTVLDVYFEGPASGVNFYIDDANVYGPKAAAPKAKPIDPNATGQIDVNIRHQEIEGFGASGAHYTMELVNHQKKTELYNLLFKELSLDIFRIRNNYDMEPNSFRETVEIAKGAEAALGRDLKIMISSWSPPGRLKSNGSTVGGTLKKNNDKYMYTDLAQWWYDSVAAYARASVKADYINIQNEPDYEAKWDSCRFAPTSDSNLAGYDAAFEAVWQKLNTEMGPAMPKMLAPETYSLSSAKDYIDNLDDLSHVYGYAHHLYGCSGCAEAPDRYLPGMNNLKSKYGNKPLLQTEFQHEPSTWTSAMNTAILMHNCLTVENAAAYLYWELFWGPGSGMVSLNDPCTYTINPAYYAFKQYSAFIDSDWQRVEASTGNTSLKISAYISPDNQKLTVVIINVTAETNITIDLAFKGFSISKGELYRSTQTKKCVRLGSFNRPGLLTLPAHSITTLVLSASEN